jgi:hypothetical protein
MGNQIDPYDMSLRQLYAPAAIPGGSMWTMIGDNLIIVTPGSVPQVLRPDGSDARVTWYLPDAIMDAGWAKKFAATVSSEWRDWADETRQSAAPTKHPTDKSG